MEGETHFVVRMKITTKRRMSRSFINNKQNLERYARLQTALLHITGTAIQERILAEELGYPRLPVAPVAHRLGVLADKLQGPGVLPVPDHSGFPFVDCNTAPNQDCHPVLRTLKPDTDWPPYGRESFQAPISKIKRFHLY